MKNIKIFVILILMFVSPFFAMADEGMWMIQNINAALQKKMQARGLKLAPNEIYNADAPGASVSDAVIALGFYCTGSIISDNGLLITNHHCAFSDIHDISTPQHNYLEEGYWAMQSKDEIPIPGKEVFFLKKVIDVTQEVKDLYTDLGKQGKPFGFRKVSSILEKKYSDETSLQASLSSMWRGEKYYMALYKVYTDLRLVAAPPVSIAAFGGDIDNWEWPQQKCDFAMYRVYAAADGEPAKYSKDNVPLNTSANHLKISLDGYKPGSFTMVIGYPGVTNRYSTASELNEDVSVELPITNELRSNQMKIMMKWMNQDPTIRLKYSDRYFMLSNVQENDEGKVQCVKRFNVIKSKQDEEKELQAWIDADPARKAKWGNVLSDMSKDYALIRDAEKDRIYFRETMFRGTNISVIMMRMDNTRNPQGAAKVLRKNYDGVDPRPEFDLLSYAVEQYYSHVDSSCFGPYQKSLVKEFGTDYKAIANYLWENTCLSSQEKVDAFTNGDLSNDAVNKFFKDANIMSFNKKGHDLSYREKISDLDEEFTHAKYEMNEEKGIAQYPDANSTMRLSYGVVGDLQPKDGVECSWRSTTAGVLQKYDASSYDFHYPDRFKSLLEAGDWGRYGAKEGKKTVMYADFLTDNDITGGNSGSPVLNAKGELIGLAFDGNKESLASDNYYTPGYNKCVCVDIRYVLWTLDKYAGMQRILDEIKLK
jgi:hypothetical protein